MSDNTNINDKEDVINNTANPLSAMALIGAAKEARSKAYAPYSQFKVGAALLAEDGKIFTGCNIENAVGSTGVCAERVAIANAVGAGVKEFKAIAVVGGAGAYTFCPPCGTCRQVLAEFCDEDFIVYVGNTSGYKEFTLGELLPYNFSLEMNKEG